MRPIASSLLLLVLAAAPSLAQATPLEGVALERVAEPDRRELLEVTGAPTVDCQVEETVRASTTVYRFLLAHLAFASRAIEALDLDGTGRYAIEDAGDGRFTIDDHAGAFATCSRPSDEDGLLVVLARGHVEVPVLPRVLGTGVIVVRYEPSEDDPGLLRARCRILFRLTNRLLHALTAPLRDTLSRVLADKLSLLIRSASALAVVVERDPWAVLAAVERAGTASAEDLAAYRQALLLR
jgi:hypothetical protein